MKGFRASNQNFSCDVLYITQNGITEPLGRSQVAPYIMELAKLGYKIHILSAEKDSGKLLIPKYEHHFNQAGVRWSRVRYRFIPPIFGQLLTHLIMLVKAFWIIKTEAVSVVHCRSFPPATIAFFIKKFINFKYIFDFRDFHADGGMSRSKGIKWFFYRVQKYLEGPMLVGSSKVVCLTERAVNILGNSYFGGSADYHKLFQVVPCCADFNFFQRPSALILKNLRSNLNIGDGSFILLYLGSLGEVYMLSEMLTFFRQVCKYDQSAIFLFVSNNGYELIERECKLQHIPMDKIRYVQADRSEVPNYISLAELSVFFISPDSFKEGCSPTKLAEIFACNIPIVTNYGIGDLDKIISLDKNASVVIKNFSEQAMFDAIQSVMQVKATQKVNIRKNSKQFSLEVGVDSYAHVYKELLGKNKA